jgi:hypothetical protein
MRHVEWRTRNAECGMRNVEWGQIIRGSNFGVNFVVTYFEVVHDKVHEVVIRDGSRQGSRVSFRLAEVVRRG